MSTLTTKYAKMLEERGYTQITSAQDKQRQSGGITHTIFEHEETGEHFLVRAKESVYQNLAPFGAGMLEHALEENDMLVIYFDDREQFYVFDPRYVEEHGVVESNYSKRPDERDWVEVSLDHGVALHQYERGEDPDFPGQRKADRSLEEFL